MSNKITLSDIENIIDNHFEAERNFMFVVDRDTAVFIAGYIDDVYGLEDEDEVFAGIEDDVDECFVSVYFDRDDEYNVFCENARGSSGKYKFSELDNCDYFIMASTGMCDITADKLLCGENCTWSWFEIVEDEECDIEELDDSTIEEFRLIYETLNTIQKVYPCPDCLRDAITDLAFKFKEIGWQDCKDTFNSIIETLKIHN